MLPFYCDNWFVNKCLHERNVYFFARNLFLNLKTCFLLESKTKSNTRLNAFYMEKLCISAPKSILLFYFFFFILNGVDCIQFQLQIQTQFWHRKQTRATCRDNFFWLMYLFAFGPFYGISFTLGPFLLKS